jgi:hypothetical protein
MRRVTGSVELGILIGAGSTMARKLVGPKLVAKAKSSDTVANNDANLTADR